MLVRVTADEWVYPFLRYFFKDNFLLDNRNYLQQNFLCYFLVSQSQQCSIFVYVIRT